MKEYWRLEKRVPLALLLSLLLQLAGGLIWASQLDARVEQLEQSSMARSGLNEKFGRLEERLDSLKQNILVMRQQMDRLTDKLLEKHK